MLNLLKAVPLVYWACLVLAMAGAGGLWLWSALSDAYERGENACRAAQIENDNRMVKARGEKEHEIISLPDAELDERYSRWLRD